MGRPAKFDRETIKQIRMYMSNPTFTNKEVMAKFGMSTVLFQKIKKGEHPYEIDPQQELDFGNTAGSPAADSGGSTETEAKSSPVL